MTDINAKIERFRELMQRDCNSREASERIALSWGIACHYADNPPTVSQPVTVSPLALFMADKTMTLALECLRLGRPLTAEAMADLVKQTTVAAIEAAAKIEGGAK